MLKLEGNALDVSSLKATCEQCGVPANMNSAQEVGLDPTDPGFDGRANELTAGFRSLTYYVGTVKGNQLELTPRQRTEIELPLAIFCKTCNKSLGLNEIKPNHDDHDVTITPLNDTPLSPQILDMVRKHLSKHFGEEIH
jgi:hypothetical protein